MSRNEKESIRRFTESSLRLVEMIEEDTPIAIVVQEVSLLTGRAMDLLRIVVSKKTEEKKEREKE